MKYLGTVTGRFASSKPNLQNIPRSEPATVDPLIEIAHAVTLDMVRDRIVAMDTLGAHATPTTVDAQRLADDTGWRLFVTPRDRGVSVFDALAPLAEEMGFVLLGDSFTNPAHPYTLTLVRDA